MPLPKKQHLLKTIALLGGAGILWALVAWGAKRPSVVNAVQKGVNPGKLSAAHASLENDCRACHTPGKGVEASNCIVCHANNEAVLKRQPTSFHANIGSCAECHLEHEGRAYRPTLMDHNALAHIGLAQLKNEGDTATDNENQLLAERLKRWLRKSPDGAWGGHPELKPAERTLDCSTCHQNDDRHYQLFGNDCAVCHSSTKWNIPEFRHPPSTSMDCSQCHQAPPSHYMMHFKMISQKVAGDHHAKVEQCYRCHQTTSWNDIKRAGWYKHH